MTKTKIQKRKGRGTGLAEHASTAAFTTSRALTSHLRKRYRERYHEKYRYAKVLFSFDLALLGLAVFLVGMNVYLFTVLPVPLQGYRLDLITPALKSAAPVALEARVMASGERDRQNVRLVWEFPPGTEILQSEPPIGQDGAYLGTLAPGETLSSRVVVRLFQPEGDVLFRFRLRDADGEIDGETSRALSGSGLYLEPIIPVASVVQGAMIPYRVRNDTSLPLEGITLFADRSTTLNGLNEVRISRLEPFEERIVSVQPSASSEVSLTADIRGVSILHRVEPYALLEADPTGVSLELDPSDAHELSFHTSTDRAASIAVWHPGLSDEGHVRILDLSPEERDIRLDVEPTTRESTWYVIPFVARLDGNALGVSAAGVITTPFEVHASARYFAASGDQIGIGPLPPRVGETTKVWIGIKLAPTTSELTNIRVSATLASGIQVTGRSALPDGGAISQTDNELVWNLDVLPATTAGASVFFEVELTPMSEQRGQVPLLVNAIRAEASDMRTGLNRESLSGPLDMNLSEDEYGKNLGKVE